MPTRPGASRRRRDAFDAALLDAVAAHVAARRPRRVVVVAGDIGAGKTQAGLRLVGRLREAGFMVGGILAPRLFDHGETTGYNVLDLSTGEDAAFARPDPPGHAVGRFYVRAHGLAFAERALRQAAMQDDVVLVDEVGRWELGGGGHAAALRAVLQGSAVPVLFVRSQLVDAIVERFGLREPHIARLTDDAVSRESAEAQRSFWAIADSVPYPLLVTLAPDGFPQSRPMTLVMHDETTLWFPISLGSRKVEQVRAHPEVTVLFVDNDKYNYASFHGLATVDSDRDRARQVWRDDWLDDWPGGVDDGDYALLRVDGIRGFYLRGTTGEAGEIDLRGETGPWSVRA